MVTNNCIYLRNKTSKFFYKLSLVVYICGLPNFWYEDIHFSKKFTNLYKLFTKSINSLVTIFIFLEIIAFFTQNNLSEKQRSDLVFYSFSHPMLWCYGILLSSRVDQVKKVLCDMLELLNVFGDEEVERQMVKKSKLYSAAFLGICSMAMIMYNFDAIVQVFMKGNTFTTVITAWPNVEDNSTAANIARFCWNLAWWAWIIRVIAVYALVFSLFTCLSHQFIHLQRYFLSLNKILEKNIDNEMEFIEGFKLGIKLHCATLECVKQSKAVCGAVLSGQIISNLILLAILMKQLVESDRTLMSTSAIAMVSISILTGSGLFMCNAGDVTVEASELATAMFFSGWQHCQKSSTNIRKLVVFSMVIAQKPVVIMGLGIVKLSYESYVSLVKATYSVFSFLY